ncbi:protein yellow-related [Anaeramoeba flamelloides]|uniref:Protein yellow-related n=1 Tax=Anaeramoeba flamelloides TaxID=1746091 RepID=A0AAV7YV49_9EUKA|nr:protein yellow-related [Anaeramoeba flamelloides]
MSYVDYTFQTQEDRDDYINNKLYKNVLLAGIKVSVDGEYFVTMPRWKEKVPATLGKIVVDASNHVMVQPYPSWEMNKIGDADAIQSVLGIEIDNTNTLWILDQGKVNGSSAIKGSIKLLAYDLNTDKLVHKKVFPPEIASLSDSFLNDVVVDTENSRVYISDSGITADPSHSALPGLIIWDYKKDDLKRVLSNVVSTKADDKLWIKINGEKVLLDNPMETGADGIALTPNGKKLFWCPLTSHTNYYIKTKYLWDDDKNSNEKLQEKIKTLKKISATDGMSFDNQSRLFVSSLEYSGILWDADPTKDSEDKIMSTLLVNNSKSMMWPDTLAFDHQGWLVFVSNQLHRFLNNELIFSVDNSTEHINFRIWKTYIGTDSYSFVTEKEDSSHFAAWKTALISCFSTAAFIGIVVLIIFVIRKKKKKKKKSKKSNIQKSLLKSDTESSTSNSDKI